MDGNSFVLYKTSKGMVLDGNMFVFGMILGLVATLMQLSLSSQTLQLKTGVVIFRSKIPDISFKRLRNGITSHIAEVRAIYSLSVVLRAISVCSLLCQVIGQPANMITNPVLERTDSELVWSPSFQPPAKSAST